MQRQMFAKGGAAFPDMSGDGRVTQKDILMGRGVIPMQEGGDPMAMAAMMPPQDPAAMMDPMAGGQAMDPEVVQSLLQQAQSNLENIDEAEDYATVINSIRGDDAPIEARYAELAELVGPEDAQQTPESVLALVQPAIIMNAVDQGIGGLAAEEMTAPVEGAMAEGIMSTVAPPPQPEMMAAPPAAPGPMMMGGPPPVNFNQGGLVRRGDNQPVIMMQTGGDPIAAAGRLGELYEQKMPLYQSIVGDQSAALEEQKKLTQAQMLFDVAGAALAYANPTQAEIQAGRKLSPAERLAAAVTETKLLPTISARAGEQLKAKQAAEGRDTQMKLSALTAAEAGLTAEAKAKSESALAAQKAKAEAEQKALDRQAETSNILLKGSVDMEMAETKENWRAAAADTQRLAEKEAATLLASRNLAAQEAGKKLQNQLDISKMLLDSELTLDRLGVEDAYKLNQQKIGHDYAMTLQEASLKVTRARDANNVALRIADQEIEEAKMLQTADRDAAIARAEQKKLALEQEKFELDKAAKGLETFGNTGKNKAESILANPDILEGYANNTLDKTKTLEVNNAIDMLSSRETVTTSDGQTIKTGGNIPEAARQAVIKRSQIGGENLLLPREVKRITAQPTQFGEAVSKIMSSVPDASIAFGSDAVARNLVNVAVEAATFGLAKAPYEQTEKAISAVKQLNLDTLTHFQDIKQLRDSVTLMKKLEEQTANPKEFLTGDTRAKNKTKTMLNTIDELLSVLDLKVKNESDVEKLNEANLAKQKALQLRAGFVAIDNAYARLGSGGKTVTSSDEAEQDAILFGDNK